MQEREERRSRDGGRLLVVRGERPTRERRDDRIQGEAKGAVGVCAAALTAG
jgi:hypothetical protein